MVLPEAFARAGVGRTFQNLRLIEELSIFDNVALGLNSRLRTVAGIPVASRRRVRREVAAACAQAGLDMPSWRPVESAKMILAIAGSIAKKAGARE